jgi:hypothetical protein
VKAPVPPQAAPEASGAASTEALRAEADRCHAVLFGADAPEEIKRRYVEALWTLPIAALENTAQRTASGADLEAMEFALRKRNPFNPLTQRFRVVCYLAEARADYFHRFVAERRGFLAGLFAVSYFALRSLYLSLRVKYLVRRYGIG